MKKFTRTGIVILLAIVVVMTLSFWMVKLQKGKPESSSSSSETEIGDVYIVIDNSYSTNKNADKGSGANLIVSLLNVRTPFMRNLRSVQQPAG